MASLDRDTRLAEFLSLAKAGSVPVIERFFPEVGAGGFSRIDGTIEFYTRVNALLAPNMTVLNFGAGRGQAVHDDPSDYRRRLCALRGKAARVIGADPDPVVRTNPDIDEAIVMDLAYDGSFALPLGDAVVDLIVSDFTFEHVTNPAATVAELNRVLKPGGWLCARTPNKWGYIGLGNQIVPEAMKKRLLQRLQPNRKEEDVFPAVYRMNTISGVAAMLLPLGYRNLSYAMNAEPAYFGHSSLMWRLMLGVNRLAPTSLGSMLLLFLQKSGHAVAGSTAATDATSPGAHEVPSRPRVAELQYYGALVARLARRPIGAVTKVSSV